MGKRESMHRECAEVSRGARQEAPQRAVAPIKCLHFGPSPGCLKTLPKRAVKGPGTERDFQVPIRPARTTGQGKPEQRTLDITCSPKAGGLMLMK